MGGVDNDSPLPQNRGYAADHIRRFRGLRKIDAGETARRRLEKWGIRHLLQHSEDNHAMTPETELLLFEASRSQLVREKIQPALRRGEWVICDRFFDSTTVYQGAARQLHLGLVKKLNAFVVGDCVPDLTFVLDIDRATAQSRLGNRKKIRDRMKENSDEFHERMIRAYRELAENEPRRVILIDGRISPDTIVNQIWNTFAQRFPDLGNHQTSKTKLQTP
jgi:dTMP kinase